VFAKGEGEVKEEHFGKMSGQSKGKKASKNLVG
jgi:hypothetical protein